MKISLRQIARALSMVAIMVALGLTTGAAFRPSAAVAAQCEADECEHGMFGDSCQDNPGQKTGCDFTGGNCTTIACDPT